MELGLTDKRALVLGASRGLGRGIAAALAREGALVTLVGRDRGKLAEAAADIGANASWRAADLADSHAVTDLAASACDVDILVLNGGGPPPGSLSAVADEAWRASFEAMVLAPMRLARAALPAMRRRKFGRILIVLSSGVIQPIAELGMSNTLRLALVGWAKTLAAEVAADGITVNGIAPGRIHTDRIDALDGAAATRQNKPLDDVRAASRATIPAGRYGRVDEFADVVVFLASHNAAYVTGSVIRVDGGLIRAI